MLNCVKISHSFYLGQLKQPVIISTEPLNTMHVDANDLRRDNVALLVKKRDIWISKIDDGSPAYTDENWDILAEVIRKTTTLEKLDFRRKTVIALQHDKVFDALTKNRTIKILDLWYAHDGDKGAKAVAAILKENSTIESVHLGNNDIGVEGAKAIADALKHNKTLRHIDLNFNQIGHEGAKAIAEALQDNASLQVLRILRNNIGEKGAKVIAEALKQNTSLQKLLLSCNSIGDEGAKAIADSLKENASLRELDIKGNNIGDEGAKVIADALKKNTTLQTIDLGYNNISEEGGKHILNALQQIETSVIKVIDLDYHNKVSKETRANIDKEMIRIKEGFKSANSNEGQIVANAAAAGGSQGVQNKRSSNGDEGMPTIHTPNVSRGGSAENVHETNQTGPNTTAMETKIKEQQSTITQLQSKIAEQEKELASTKDILKTIGNLANGKDGGTTRNTGNDSSQDRETELQSEIERYKQEVDSLKEKLKNSRPIIETVDLTNEIDPASSSGGDDSIEEKPPSKRRRMKSNLAVALEQTQQMVQVKEEAKERAAVAEANVASARREKDAVEASLRDKQEDLEVSEETVNQQLVATNILQGRIDELCELARAVGVDGSLLSEIRYRDLSSGR